MDIGVKLEVPMWNPSLKYLSTVHFLTKITEIFCGVKLDGQAAEESRHSRSARIRLETEEMLIFGHL